MPTRRFRSLRLAGCLAALLASGALAACGSSGGSGSQSSAAAGASSTAAGGESSTAHGGCRSVSAPAPKGRQRIPQPTAKLDPARRYVVSLATNCGAIAIELDVKRAPKTAASFAYLVRRGFYDDLTFHRIAANFVIQGGDPEGTGSGGPGYTIVEPPPSNLRYTRGTVAMAKTAAEPSGASGSQFFIVTANEAPLPAQYALVGKVVGGLGGVDAIAALPTSPPQDGAPTSPVVISHATLSGG
jgi:peptidyl-prolyl cis-trans isomerase B (cyclophilin B)